MAPGPARRVLGPLDLWLRLAGGIALDRQVFVQPDLRVHGQLFPLEFDCV